MVFINSKTKIRWKLKQWKLKTMGIKEELGLTLEISMPSGFTVTIREQNGEDDDILSNMSNTGTTALHTFLAGIIIENDSIDKGKYTTPNDIKKWKLKDKYYLTLKSRLHSLGNELEFNYICKASTCSHKAEYEEDLSEYDQDLGQAIKKVGDMGYKPNAITPYPNKLETHRTLELASKQIIKYKYLDGIGENKVLDMPQNTLTKNAELIARSIQLKLTDDKWQTIENFKLFTAREMREIRSDIKKNDAQFEMFTEIKCPKCGDIENTPLISFQGFFFPEDN